MTMNKGKLLFSHVPEEDPFTLLEVYECDDCPGGQILELSDTDRVATMQRIHLPVAVRAALVEALES